MPRQRGGMLKVRPGAGIPSEPPGEGWGMAFARWRARQNETANTYVIEVAR